MNKRIGETSIASNGQKMTIIEYRNCYDIAVQFEDGTIVKHKSYYNFIKGHIQNPNKKYFKLLKDRTGETVKAKNGQLMTIIEYPNNRNITVQFEDGTIVKNCLYGNFKKGLILNPNSTYYDKKKKENGNLWINKRFQDNVTNEWYTIIKYASSNDVTIQFDNGEIREKLNLYKVKRGQVNHIPQEQSSKKFRKTITDKFAHKRIGETSINCQGKKMTIVAYEDARDLTIQFEDGKVLEHVQYSPFKSGLIRHPKIPYVYSNEKNASKYIGKETINNIGLKMKIIGYRNTHDIDVQFEDGIVIEHHDYYSFKKGSIPHPYKRKHYGEIYTDSNGVSLKIIKCLKYNSFDIQFDDGTIMENIGLPSIKNKTIFKKYYKRKK